MHETDRERFRRFEETAKSVVDSCGNKELQPPRPFKPHIFIETVPGRPSQIWVVALCGIERFKHIAIPAEMLEWHEERLLPALGKIVKTHYAWVNGRVPLFGAITGYIVRLSEDESFRLTIEGKVAERIVRTISEPEARFKIDGKEIPKTLFGL